MKKVIFSIIFFAFLLVASVSAYYPCSWDTYGGELVNMPNYQYYSDCRSLFNQTSITTLSYSSASNYANSKTAFQLLIAGLGNEETPRLIFPNGNYLQVYDNALTLLTEINIGNTVDSQIDVGDLDGDGFVDDIAGIFQVSSSNFSFRIYEFNKTSLLLSLKTELNFTDNSSNFGTAGLRCIGGSSGIYGTCYSSTYSSNASSHYNLYFTQFYGNGSYLSQYIGYSLSYPREPLSWADWDNDGVTEFLLWTDYDVIVFSGSIGNQERKINCGDGVAFCRYARFYTPLTASEPSFFEELFGITSSNIRLIYGQERLNGATQCGGGTFKGSYIASIKSDGTTAWSVCQGETGSSNSPRIYGLSIADYDGDLKDDIWFVRGVATVNQKTEYKIYKGDDGSVLYSYQSPTTFNYAGSYPNTDMIISRLDNDATPDFLSFYPSGVRVFSPAKNQELFSSSISSKGCVSGDLTFDGLQDIVCSTSSTIYSFIPDYTNQLPDLIQVTFEPSTSILVYDNLNLIILANDTEGDIMRYSHTCYSGQNKSIWDGSNVKSCSYDSAGYYEVTLYVSDIFHDYNGVEYNQLSQTVFVSVTGTSCNNNGVCESSLGETITTCPADCPTTPQTITSVDGTAIPTKLVDATDEEAGLFPLVYRSTVTFFSAIFIPLIVIVFGIFTSLIIITIFGILKKLVDKIN